MNLRSGFASMEFVASMALVAVISASMAHSRSMTSDREMLSRYSCAAQSLAAQSIEQARSAQWNPRAVPAVDELGTTNFARVEQLGPPLVGGDLVLATNYIRITCVSSAPPLRQLRSDCVWMLPGHGSKAYGPYTNTVVSLRAID